MTPIKNIVQDITSANQLREQERVQSSKTQKLKREGQTKEADAAKSAASDSVNISPAARQLAESQSEVARYQEQLQALREESNGRIAQIRERISQGEFDQPQVLEGVAEAIVRLPQFQSLAEQGTEAPRSREVRRR